MGNDNCYIIVDSVYTCTGSTHACMQVHPTHTRAHTHTSSGSCPLNTECTPCTLNVYNRNMVNWQINLITKQHGTRHGWMIGVTVIKVGLASYCTFGPLNMPSLQMSTQRGHQPLVGCCLGRLNGRPHMQKPTPGMGVPEKDTFLQSGILQANVLLLLNFPNAHPLLHNITQQLQLLTCLLPVQMYSPPWSTQGDEGSVVSGNRYRSTAGECRVKKGLAG